MDIPDPEGRDPTNALGIPWFEIPTEIPGLRHLASVPNESWGYGWRGKYLRWREEVKGWRKVVWAASAKDTGFAEYQENLCADDACYFLTVFGYTWEPRYGGETPLILLPHQIRAGRIMDAAMKTTGRLGDVTIEKARDMGMTTFCVGWAYHHWNWWLPFSAGLVSRHEGLVDIGPGKGTDSMFAKIDFIRLRLPEFLIPQGWDERAHRMHLLIQHPSKPNTIVGEATTSLAGRGQRHTVRLNDEKDLVRDQEELEAGQMATTLHIVDLSSPGLKYGTLFQRKVAEAAAGRGSSHVRASWDQHPEHTPELKEAYRSRMRLDPQKFEREFELNYLAGSGDLVYEIAQTKEIGLYPYVPGWRTYATIDPGLRDFAAVAWVQKDPETGRFRVVRAYQRSGMPAGFWASIFVGHWEGGADSYDFTDEEYALMSWTRELGRVLYFGDPAVNIRNQETGSTFNEGLRRTSARLLRDNGKTGQVYVQTTRKEGRNNFPERIRCLREMLYVTDFHDDPRVSDLLTALKEAHFPSVEEGAQSTREIAAPVHDHGSHYRSAMEFLAVNLAERVGSGGSRRAPIIRDAAGRVVTTDDRRATYADHGRDE